MSSYPNKDQVLFPNASPDSLDNFEHKKKPVKEGLKVESDDGLNKAMSSLMTEYAKDMKASEKKNQEGMLTGTSMNTNLLEGDLINYSRNDITKNPIQPFTEQLQKLDESVGVVSYKEGLTNDDRPRLTVNPTTVTSATTGITTAGKSQKLIDLETRLSALTTEYTTQYRFYTDDLMTRSQFLQTNTQYLNKVIRDISYVGLDASAAYYYVNPFGYTHRYADLSSVILYDAATCPQIRRDEAYLSTDLLNPFKLTPQSYIDISGGTPGGGFSRFKNLNSYNMAGYVPCIVARNIKLPGPTASEDKYAWVDTEGRKHIYTTGVWPEKRHPTCINTVVGDPIVVTANQYNSLPTAEDQPMGENSECFRVNVSPTIHSKLAEIKKKIDDTVEEIKKENQSIVNNVANTTIVRRDKTTAEKLASLDDTILAKIKEILGDSYYPLVYVFWCFIILIAILLIFKFAFMFSSPSENGGGEGGDEGGINVPLLGVVIMSLIVIFAVYYYFSYTYNLSTSSNARYTVI
jgi:hypothetical protein